MLKRWRYNLSIYTKLQLLHIRAHMEYRLDFFIGVFGAALKHFSSFVFLWARFSTVPQVNGWSLWEIAFLYGLLVIPQGLVEVFCDGQWRLRFLVNTGELDRLMLRPISPALQIITQLSSIHGLGTAGVGLLVLLRAVAELGIAWNIGHVVYLLLTLVSSIVIIGAINFATNCIGFWDQSATGSFPVLIYNMAEFAKFPITPYARLFQFAFTWVLPFAFITYYPALVLLNRPEATAISIFAPLASALVVLVTWFIWWVSLRRYQGVGH